MCVCVREREEIQKIKYKHGIVYCFVSETRLYQHELIMKQKYQRGRK